MKDLIYRQQAIYVASGYCHPANIADELRKLPSAQPEPCEDAVSREAVIAKLKDMRKHGDMIPWEGKRVFEAIRHLPSAQPEIIRCKDCKWYGRVDKRRFYRGMDCLKKRIDTIIPDKDFCSRAERREE